MSAPPHIRWRNSLIARVIFLCAVLVLCLLGSVYVLTTHYYQEVVAEMGRQATDIAQSVEVWLDENPNLDPDTDVIVEDMPELTEDEFKLEVVSELLEPSRLAPELGDSGYAFVATQYFPWKGSWVKLTTRFTIDPQEEVFRAFRNRYLFALSICFFVALGLMIYLIAINLRPLRELSASLSRISSGELENVTSQSNTAEIRALEDTFNRMVESLREKETVEANLRQAQRLSAIGNLAAGVAHDVRNPLNAMKLLSSHAIDTLEDSPNNETAIKQIRTIRNEVNRLEEIVSGFLALAREEELKREDRAIDPLLEECINLVHKDAETRKVRLTSELRAKETVLHIDPKQMTRAIINVLINALEACPEGGRVRMFSRVIDDSCEIEVRDDGPGMPRDVLEHVFDPYYTTKTTGTGLGLSITRGIIEEHGGAISITSTQGHGSQVLISLPLQPAPAEA